MIYLQWLRRKMKINQEELAQKMDVKRTTISMWEKEKSTPPYDTLRKLSAVMGEPVGLLVQKIVFWSEETFKEFDALSSNEEKVAFMEKNGVPAEHAKFYYFAKNKREAKKAAKIPVLGYVKGGNPETAFEEVIGYEEISDSLMNSGEYFGLIVKGDSMEPRFNQGDTVIVRKQDFAESGNIVVALIGRSEATIKKLIIEKDGITLQPLNSSYKSKYFSKDEVNDVPVTVLGKVVELRARF